MKERARRSDLRGKYGRVSLKTFGKETDFEMQTLLYHIVNNENERRRMQEEIEKEKKELLEVLEKGEKDFQEGNFSPADEVMKRIDEEVKKRFEMERRK